MGVEAVKLLHHVRFHRQQRQFLRQPRLVDVCGVQQRLQVGAEDLRLPYGPRLGGSARGRGQSAMRSICSSERRPARPPRPAASPRRRRGARRHRPGRPPPSGISPAPALSCIARRFRISAGVVAPAAIPRCSATARTCISASSAAFERSRGPRRRARVLVPAKAQPDIHRSAGDHRADLLAQLRLQRAQPVGKPQADVEPARVHASRTSQVQANPGAAPSRVA
jgi:hypothetical protein